MSINGTTKERMVLTKNGQEPGSSCLDGYIFSLSLSPFFSTLLSVRVSPLLVRIFFFSFFSKYIYIYMHVCTRNIMHVHSAYRVCYT